MSDDKRYFLQLSESDVGVVGAALRAADDPRCREFGRKLGLYFPLHRQGCAFCGNPADLVYPDSPGYELVHVDGLAAVGHKALLACKGCINRYYVDKGDAAAFPDVPPTAS